MDLSALPEGISEEEVLRAGFHPLTSASSAGVRFTVGKVPLEDDTKAITKKFLLCKVAVGRAYNSTEDFAKIAAVPEGYDSFVLDRPGGAKADECCSEKQNNNEYIIKDASQVLPTYVVSVEYDPLVERRSRQKVQCENCEAAVATVFCQADAANLCASCDAAMHSSKLAARHQRVALDQGPQTFSCCRAHPDKIVEFFCPACSKPVCVHCKMVGHHSVGDAARHKLVTVAEAFRSVSEAAKAEDPVLEARKAAIRQQIEAVNERAKAVEANAAQVQQSLEELYRRAQNDLKTLTKKKLNILKGDAVELSRELAEISALEAFLAYQQAGGNATQFILDWAHHQRLRTELHAFAHFREAIDVQPDIKINGAIQVHVEGAGLPLALQESSAYCTSAADHMASMKGSVMFEGKQQPKYVGGQQSGRAARPLPTFDLGAYAKGARKGSDYVMSSMTMPQYDAAIPSSPTKN